jgi:hypothetical protein
MNTIDLIVRIASLIGLVISIVLVYVQMRKTHDWNRRKATQDIVDKCFTGDIADVRMTLQTEFSVNLKDTSQSYESILKSIKSETDRKRYEFKVRALFNYFEIVSAALKNNILDEDVCYDQLGLAFCVYWKWGEFLIHECRKSHPTVYIEWEHYVRQWTETYASQTATLRKPGKRPT